MKNYLDLLHRIKNYILRPFLVKKYNNTFLFWEKIYSSLSIWQIDRPIVLLRVGILIVLFGFLYLVITVKLLNIALLNSSPDFKSRISIVKKNVIKRKEIVDRNGKLLAVNLSTASLFANPKKIISASEAGEKLSKILPELDKNKLIKELSSDKSFFWIRRDLTPKEQYAIHNLGIPGLYFEKENKRVYTYGNLFSHVLGFVGRDANGLAGIEKHFDKMLISDDYQLKKNEANKALELSLDIGLQNIVSEELEKTIKEFSAIGGVCIVADAENGQVLALVSKPDFDPHNPSKASDDQLFNKASLGNYEMGSVFKTITIAIGFDSEKVALNDVYDLNTKIKIAKLTVKDVHKKDGWRTVPEIFMYSSNIGTVQIVFEVGKKLFKDYLRKLGLFNQLNIELPERATPLFPSEKKWTDIETVTASYGYAIAITPLHVVQAVIPIVNGGKFYPLTLLKNSNLNKKEERIFKSTTSLDINKLLRLSVEKGTGKKAAVPGYLVGGKTGTAEKLVGGKYSKTTRLSSFIAAFPMTKPKYVIYVMLDEPKGTKETFGYAGGGFTAAPTVGKIISRMGSLYTIPPIDENSEEVRKKLNVEYKIDEEI